MERSEIKSLFDDFNENYIDKKIAGKTKLSLDYFDHGYIIADLRVDGYSFRKHILRYYSENRIRGLKQLLPKH